MKRKPLKWVGLAAAAALLAAGCTAQPQNVNRLNQSNLFTTTGDADTCAAALGNTVRAGAFWSAAGVNRSVTANGVIIGNVALVALPRESRNTPADGATGNGAQTGAAAGTGAANGLSTGVQRDGDVTGNLGTLTPPGTVDTTPSHVGTVPGNTGSTAMTPGWGATRGATGVVGGRAGTGTTVAADPLERVRTACPTLADIRVVNDENDRARLAEITAAVRSGRPITEFLSELATMAQRATSAGPGASGRQWNRPENRRNQLQQGNVVPGRPGAPNAPAAPRTPPGPNAPGTDGRGSTPERPGSGGATGPGTSAND